MFECIWVAIACSQEGKQSRILAAKNGLAGKLAPNFSLLPTEPR